MGNINKYTKVQSRSQEVVEIAKTCVTKKPLHLCHTTGSQKKTCEEMDVCCLRTSSPNSPLLRPALTQPS